MAMLLTRVQWIRDRRYGDSCTKFFLCARRLRAALAPRIFIRCSFILHCPLTWKLEFSGNRVSYQRSDTTYVRTLGFILELSNWKTFCTTMKGYYSPQFHLLKRPYRWVVVPKPSSTEFSQDRTKSHTVVRHNLQYKSGNC